MGTRRNYAFIACGIALAYVVWNWWHTSYSSNSNIKSINDKKNKRKGSRSTSGDEDMLLNQENSNIVMSSENNKEGVLDGDDTGFTIVSSHAYDLSEEDEVVSHNDSFNESQASLINDFTNNVTPTETA